MLFSRVFFESASCALLSAAIPMSHQRQRHTPSTDIGARSLPPAAGSGALAPFGFDNAESSPSREIGPPRGYPP